MAETDRGHYPLIATHPELHYWDCAATTPSARPVIEAVKHYTEKLHANVHRGQYQLAVDSTAAFEKARGAVRDFLHAPDDWIIIFNSGATAGLNTVASGLDLLIHAGDVIVITADAHHSLLIPLQQLAIRRQATIEIIPINEDGSPDAEAWGEAIARRPRLVALPHVSNVTGRIHNLDQLTHQAKSVGAIVIVDGAQAVAHLKVELEKFDIDAYAFSGHKLYGPTGVGALALSPKLAHQLAPSQFGGGMIDNVESSSATWAELPDRLEAGTPNLSGIAGLVSAMTWVEQQREQLEESQATLTTATLEMLLAIPGLTLYGPKTAANRTPIYSFNLDGLHPHDVAEILARDNVAVRAGHHCAQLLHKQWRLPATVRASAGFFTSESDVTALRQAINKAQLSLNNGV